MKSITEWFRSWRLVSWRSAVVVAVVLYALIGFFVVPPIVKSQIEKQSLKILKRQATVEKVRCNPFALSLTIEGFSLPDRPGSVLLAWDRLYANAQASSLFRWAATLKELRIEKPYVALRRFEDGKVNVMEVMEDLDTGEPKPEEEGLPRALLQHVQVVDGRIDIDDRHRPEPLLWELGPSQVELFDICTIANREGSNEVELRLPGGGLLKVNGTVVVEPLGLDGTLVLENNSLTSSWRAVEYLFEFDLTSGTIDLDLDYQVGLEEDGPHLTVDGADVRVTDYGLRWEGHDIDLLQVDSINVSGGHLEWPEQKLCGGLHCHRGRDRFCVARARRHAELGCAHPRGVAGGARRGPPDARGAPSAPGPGRPLRAAQRGRRVRGSDLLAAGSLQGPRSQPGGDRHQHQARHHLAL